VKVRRGLDAAVLAALAIAVPARARADGAFPAVEAVMVPADQPREIILATNFGLVITEDGGQTWNWSCERDDNAFGILYQLGPAPRRRLFAIANDHVVYSDDASCSWQIAGGLLADQAATDVFPDPTNAARVLAVGVSNGVYSLFESADGGTTFDRMPYQATGGDVINGAESARSDPRIVYVALMSPERVPKLARTSDAGAHWSVNDLSVDLGVGLFRIIAVDPDDANTALLRWASVSGGEAIALTRDGGATATKPLAIPNDFTSFARMPDGTLIVSGMAFLGQGLGVTPALWASHDGGASFQENRDVPGVRAIAQRDGILYAATDNFVDGYALGASSDGGATWQPVVRFDQITSIMACLRTNAQCQASCESLAGKGLGSPGMIWNEAVCTGAPITGGGGSAGAGAAGTTGGVGTGGAAGGGRGSSGGGCAVAARRADADFGAVAVVVALVLCARPRHRRRKKRRVLYP